MVQSDIYSTIHTENSTIIAEFTTGDLPNYTRGETTSYEFWYVTADDDLTVTDSVTVEADETTFFDDVVVESGATLTVNGLLQADNINVKEGGQINGTGTVNTYGSLIHILADYADFAGGYTTSTTLNSKIRFKEQTPNDMTADSILLGVEPSPKLKSKGINGVWGLVSGGDDPRGPALTTERFTLEVEVLAEYSEYQDHAAIRNDLGI